MTKFVKINKKRKKYFKTKYTPGFFEKMKNRGTTILVGGKRIKLNPIKDIVKKSFKKPKISAFEDGNTRVGINFQIPVTADTVFIDIKKINRSNEPWQNIAIFNNLKKNKEYSYVYEYSKGSALKIRVTYLKDECVKYSDFVFGDPNFKYYSDPPEMIIQKRKNIVLTFFNLQRFEKNGYIRIFRKENNEEEKCIFTQSLSGKILEYYDNNVDNRSFYEYRAEVYDNVGGLYNILPVKFLFERKANIRNIKIKYNKEKGFYEFEKNKEDKFEIQLHNIDTEETRFIKHSIEKNKVRFYLNRFNEGSNEFFSSNSILQIEGYDKENVLMSWSEIRSKNNSNIANIFNERVKTNYKFQNVITWNYTGNVDTFVVLKKSRLNYKIIGTLSHRESKEGYIYCIDEEYRTKRVKTEYVINAIDEFGKVINKKRLKI